MAMTLDGSNGVTFNDASLQGAAASPYVLKNRIINGAMVVDQRNAGASVTVSASSYAADRWEAAESLVVGGLTAQQISDAPAGLNNSLRITVTAAGTAGAAENTYLRQFIEGYNTADLAWGSANAQTVTISFWVKSSLTGTFSGGLFNAGANRSYVFTYAVNSANTWEQKTVTITGDTAGTWDTTNGRGIGVVFDLGSGSNQTGASGSWTASLKWKTTGSVSVIGTLNATWQITGVQFEVGSTATPFERRLYNQELANCQRYYITVGGDATNQGFSTGQAFSATRFNGVTLSFPVKMRTTPTFSYSSLSHFYVQDNIGGGIVPTVITQGANEGSSMCGSLGGQVSSGLSAGNATFFFAGTTTARLNFSAEL